VVSVKRRGVACGDAGLSGERKKRECVKRYLKKALRISVKILCGLCEEKRCRLRGRRLERREKKKRVCKKVLKKSSVNLSEDTLRSL